MASRTKDAKHKIDKLHKHSLDRIAETKKSASTKLKNVRRNFNDLSLGRSHKKQNNTNNISNIPEFDPDRPQTLPASDEIFRSISFNSPLCNKTNNCMNINSAESSYEIPRSLRSNSTDFASSSGSCRTDPPSYDEAVSSSDVSKKSSSSLSSSSDATAQQPQPALRNKHKVTPNRSEQQKKINEVENSKSPKTNDAIEDEYSVPCPNYPAPVLEEGIYGKIRKQMQEAANEVDGITSSPVCPPARTKRRKDYEAIKIRSRPESSAESNRATIDSVEIETRTTDSKFPEIFNRDISADLSEKLKLEEKNIPSPSRSESWSYYDGNDESDSPSTPEPIYANEQPIRVTPATNEPVYGVLYNADSPDNTLLTPEAVLRKRKSEEIQRQQAETKEKVVEKKLGLDEPSCSTDILKEFDPLDRLTFDKQLLSNKSNELILIENLLAEETYGTCNEDNNFDYNSLETSDDDDDSSGIPQPPERLDSLQEAQEQSTSDEVKSPAQSTSKQEDENRRTVIIHQNLKLRSDSAENIVDETNIEKFLINAETKPLSTSIDGDLSRPSPSKSHWFMGNVDAATKLNKSKSTNTVNSKTEKSQEKVDKKGLLPIFPKDEKSPPPYSEVAGEDSSSSKPNTPNLSEKRGSTTKSSMKTMFSSVMNKMEGIKRKTSFRKDTAKNEIKTVLEMIPRPCLTQRLILHEGHLIRLPCGVVEDILKELHARKAYIRDRKFQAYCDKDIKTPKENIPLEYITTIQCVNNHKFTNNAVEMYCFEITTAIPKNTGNNLTNPNMVITSNNSGNIKTQRVCHLYGVAKESERFIWMQKLLESITDVFQPGHTCKFYRAGWCYLKNSITSKWSGAWILLQKQKRKLLFYSYLDMNLETMDLRKARCLILKESDDSTNNLHVERGPTLMIDCPPYSVYLIMTSPRETKVTFLA